jgi:ribosomal protein S18 acetylase RimI-like enzyme
MAIAIDIRPLRADDVPFLREALYHAVFVPPNAKPPARTLIDLPELAAYIDRFGARSGDVGVLALAGESPVGAAWARLMRGYGYVDDDTPELSIALLPEYRGQGIGTQLMQVLLNALKPLAARVSLSVQRANPAFRLYQRLGFGVVSGDEESVIMVRSLL